MLCRGISRTGYVPKARASDGWHSDITFENVPSDYAVGFFWLDMPRAFQD